MKFDNLRTTKGKPSHTQCEKSCTHLAKMLQKDGSLVCHTTRGDNRIPKDVHTDLAAQIIRYLKSQPQIG